MLLTLEELVREGINEGFLGEEHSTHKEQILKIWAELLEWAWERGLVARAVHIRPCKPQ